MTSRQRARQRAQFGVRRMPQRQRAQPDRAPLAVSERGGDRAVRVARRCASQQRRRACAGTGLPRGRRDRGSIAASSRNHAAPAPTTGTPRTGNRYSKRAGLHEARPRARAAPPCARGAPASAPRAAGSSRSTSSASSASTSAMRHPEPGDSRVGGLVAEVALAQAMVDVARCPARAPAAPADRAPRACSRGCASTPQASRRCAGSALRPTPLERRLPVRLAPARRRCAAAGVVQAVVAVDALVAEAVAVGDPGLVDLLVRRAAPRASAARAARGRTGCVPTPSCGETSGCCGHLPGARAGSGTACCSARRPGTDR